jgi:hypothetical protein
VQCCELERKKKRHETSVKRVFVVTRRPLLSFLPWLDYEYSLPTRRPDVSNFMADPRLLPAFSTHTSGLANTVLDTDGGHGPVYRGEAIAPRRPQDSYNRVRNSLSSRVIRLSRISISQAI